MRLLYACLDRGIPIGGTKGASIHVAELLRALEAEGHTTAVAARAFADVSDTRPVYPLPVPGGLRFVPERILRRDLRELRARRKLAHGLQRAIDSFRPDVVYERYALFRTEGLGVSRRAGIPHALEVNAPLADEERRFRGLRLRAVARRAERTCWTGADFVVVPSAAMAELVRAAGQERVLVVPNGVDPELFTPRPQAEALRRSLGLEGRFVAGFAGSLKRWHDLDTLLEAAGQVHAAVLLVGDGPERERLERAAASRGVELRVTGAVAHEQVPDYLAAMDVCVAGLPPDPTLHYFSPLKALEYLAAGRPAVVAAAGDLAGLADAGAALAYAPGNPEELTRLLRKLAADSQLRSTLSRNGRAYAETRTWRSAAREIAQAAERLRSTAANA
jgi:glycosyltransferase involved in cell wall biosynthesis